MKEEWLFPGAIVPVDVETTAALVAEIKRLIDVVGGLILKQGPDYERGFIDGMQKQSQSSVDRAVNRMAQPEQEPVAWMHVMDNTEGIKANGKGIVSITQKRKHPFGKPGVDFSKSYPVTSTPLYTTPPQRTWVGLADKEAMQICVDCGCLSEDWLVLLDAIEAKLKEKNFD
jgi:hypothetical protein